MTARKHKWIDRIGNLIFLWCLAITIVTALSAGSAIVLPTNVELPLSGLVRVAADNKGRIYVGASGFSRIQIYDENGEFIASIHSPGLYPIPDFDVAPGGYIRVEESSDGGGYWRIQHDGNAIELDSDDSLPADSRFQRSGGNVKLESGTVYSLGYLSWIYPTVVRSTSRDTAVVVWQPPHLWLARGLIPIPFLALVAIIACWMMGPDPGENSRQTILRIQRSQEEMKNKTKGNASPPATTG